MTVKGQARLAGGLYLGLAPFAFFGIVYVPSALIVPGDAGATAGNIMASEGLFRAGIVSHLIGQTIFIFLVLALYRLLEAVNGHQARLMVVLALLGVPIAFLNEVNYFAALLLLSGSDYLTAIGTDRLHALMMLFLDLRNSGIVIAQIFWGLWLFPLGYLTFKSGFIPRVLGVLLMIGCIGYVGDALMLILFPDLEAGISRFTFVGELLFPLWLLFKGVDAEQWGRRALAAEHPP